VDKEKKTTTHITLRIEPELKEKIVYLAEKKKRTFSNYLRWLLSTGVENETKL